MLGLTLVGALVLAALPVHVESAGCPSADEVERSLAATLPPAPQTHRPDLARIFRREGKLHIELTSPDAVVIAERSLDRAGSCSELAALAAVVIASWESDIHADFAWPQAEPVVLVSRPILQPAALAPSPGATAAYDVAVGATLSISGSVAMGGSVAGCWLPRGARAGLRTSFEVESARTVEFAQGQAHWRRWLGSAEVDWRWRGGSTTLDLHGGLVAGWLTANGTGFSHNQSTGSLSPGGTIGMRWSWWTMRRLATWLEASVIYWSRAQTLYASPNVAGPEVPRFHGLLAIGLALGESSIRR